MPRDSNFSTHHHNYFTTESYIEVCITWKYIGIAMTGARKQYELKIQVKLINTAMSILFTKIDNIGKSGVFDKIIEESQPRSLQNF